jgi:hypothetical protein
MYAQSPIYNVGMALPVILVIAGTTIVALGIAAWLVREVALRAIERTSPDKVPAVVQALAALLHPFRLFLPWSSHQAAPDRPPADGPCQHEKLHNEKTQALQQGSSDEA